MQISTMRARHPAVVRAVLELGLVLCLWVTYSASRLLAETAMRPALDRANELLGVEVRLGIHWEPLLNDMFSTHRALGLLGSYWYATAHYVVTGVCLLWLYRRRALPPGPPRPRDRDHARTPRLPVPAHRAAAVRAGVRRRPQPPRVRRMVERGRIDPARRRRASF